jgi:hypothetical protein
MKIDEILKIIQDVPDYQTFLTVDELNESMHLLASRFPQVVQIIPLGQSRQGTPIDAMKIGSGAKTGLMYAMPHPNEPIGSMMLEFFTARLAEDEALRDNLDITWYIIKCIDVDGTRLNEGWFKGPFSLTNYAKHFYRPPGHLQVEWTFPVDYKLLHFNQPLPETGALMKLIEQVKPDFIYSLHNSGFGGVYAYISHDQPEFYPDFYRLVESHGLPLHLGEPEVPFATTFSKAIFKALTVREVYDFMEESGVPDPAEIINSGANSYEFALQFKDPLSLVCEMPYFYNSNIHDTTPSDTIRRDAILNGLEMARDQIAFFQQQYDAIKDALIVPSAFRDAIETQMLLDPKNLDAQETWARNDPSLDGIATVAEKFDSLVVSRFYHLLSMGMFVRMIQTELDTAGPRPALEDALGKAEERFSSQAAQLEKEMQYEMIPIQKLVRVQLGAGLLYANLIP